MTAEEQVKAMLVSRLGAAAESVRVARPRRVFAELPQECLRQALEVLKNEAGFLSLVAISGLDEQNRFAVMYHLAKAGLVLSVAVGLPRERPTIASVTDLFPSAELYEREVKDLLGVEITGLPEGNRYPLPDDWPDGQYPLRKDWAPDSDQRKSPETGADHA